MADSKAGIKPTKSSSPKKPRTSKNKKLAKISPPKRKPIAEDKKVLPTGTRRGPATLDQILSGGPGTVSAIDPSEEWIRRKKRRKSPGFVDYEQALNEASDNIQSKPLKPDISMGKGNINPARNRSGKRK